MSTLTSKTPKRPFRLYQRQPRTNTQKKPIYYVQFRLKNSNKRWTSGKSTGSTDFNEAMNIAYKWVYCGNIPDRMHGRKYNHTIQFETIVNSLRNDNFKQNELQQILKTLEQVYNIKGGIIPNTQSDLKVKDYMMDFWDWDKSQYIKEKRMSGKTIHKSHVQGTQGMIKNFWIPKFGDRAIGSFTKKELQTWLWELKDSKVDVGQKKEKIVNLSHSYINKILEAGIQALKYAYENKLIDNDCFTGFNYLAPNPKKKKILTIEQAETLFKKEWNHPTAKLGNQVAMLTGLRIGEILALRPSDLGDDKIYIRHNFSNVDGLKCPKNGNERIVPANKKLIDKLKRQAKTNPYNQGDNGFIFWNSTNPEKPLDNKVWGRQLKKELSEMGVENIEQITFHSWRHFFSTYIEPSLSHSDLQKVTGHLDESMLEHYASHQTEVAITKVGKVIDETLLPLANL